MVSLPVDKSKSRYQLNPSKIIALGMNYHEHIRESDTINVSGLTKEIPKEPILFAKTPNVLIGPGEPIIIPRFLREYKFDQMRVDYEAELAFIISQRCKNVSEKDVNKCIFGFTCANDVSQRNLQSSEKGGWFRGKSLDTFCPVGPQIVMMEDIIDAQNLDIVCRLNGTTVQKSNTRFMIFSISEIVSFISKNFTLLPGDLILTGTPAGVGPLKDGDIVEVEIEKVGILRNPVTEE